LTGDSHPWQNAPSTPSSYRGHYSQQGRSRSTDGDRFNESVCSNGSDISPSEPQLLVQKLIDGGISTIEQQKTLRALQRSLKNPQAWANREPAKKKLHAASPPWVDSPDFRSRLLDSPDGRSTLLAKNDEPLVHGIGYTDTSSVLHEAQGVKLDVANFRDAYKGTKIKYLLHDWQEEYQRQKPVERCEYIVDGAGARSANGCYLRNGVFNGRPKYSQVSGGGTIYWNTGRKINYRDDTTGWYYFAASDTFLPPVGTWTTDGYPLGNASPAPRLTTQDRQPGHVLPQLLEMLILSVALAVLLVCFASFSSSTSHKSCAVEHHAGSEAYTSGY